MKSHTFFLALASLSLFGFASNAKAQAPTAGGVDVTIEANPGQSWSVALYAVETIETNFNHSSGSGYGNDRFFEISGVGPASGHISWMTQRYYPNPSIRFSSIQFGGSIQYKTLVGDSNSNTWTGKTANYIEPEPTPTPTPTPTPSATPFPDPFPGDINSGMWSFDLLWPLAEEHSWYVVINGVRADSGTAPGHYSYPVVMNEGGSIAWELFVDGISRASRSKIESMSPQPADYAWITCVDTDGDGHCDEDDAFPNDPLEWQDTDGDGIGDSQDPTPFGDTEIPTFKFPTPEPTPTPLPPGNAGGISGPNGSTSYESAYDEATGRTTITTTGNGSGSGQTGNESTYDGQAADPLNKGALEDAMNKLGDKIDLDARKRREETDEAIKGEAEGAANRASDAMGPLGSKKLSTVSVAADEYKKDDFWQVELPAAAGFPGGTVNFNPSNWDAIWALANMIKRMIASAVTLYLIFYTFEMIWQFQKASSAATQTAGLSGGAAGGLISGPISGIYAALLTVGIVTGVSSLSLFLVWYGTPTSVAHEISSTVSGATSNPIRAAWNLVCFFVPVAHILTTIANAGAIAMFRSTVFGIFVGAKTLMIRG